MIERSVTVAWLALSALGLIACQETAADPARREDAGQEVVAEGLKVRWSMAFAPEGAPRISVQAPNQAYPGRISNHRRCGCRPGEAAHETLSECVMQWGATAIPGAPHETRRHFRRPVARVLRRVLRAVGDLRRGRSSSL